RFARGLEAPLLPMAVLSPTVLPGINLMLDVPAVALTVTAVALFLRATDRNSPSLAVAAGAVAALAMQTKYTGFVAVPGLVGGGFVYRRPLLGLLAGAVAVGLFAGWGGVFAWGLKGTPLLYHPRRGAAAGSKLKLFSPLVALLGALAAPVALVGLAGLGLPRRWLAVAAAAVVAGFVLLARVPEDSAVLTRSADGLPRLTVSS